MGDRIGGSRRHSRGGEPISIGEELSMNARSAIASGLLKREMHADRKAYKRYLRDFYYERFMRVRVPLLAYAPRIAYGLALALVLGLATSAVLDDGVLLLVFLSFYAAYVAALAAHSALMRLRFGSGAVRVSSVIDAGVPGRFGVAERSVDLDNYIAQKPNRNVFVCGTSGVGKTFLTRYLLERSPARKVIFNFKPNDHYLKLGYRVADIGSARPNPFTDAEGFVNAFLITFPVNSIGITAQYVPILLRRIAESSGSWQEFDEALDRAIAGTRDRLQLSALLYVREHMRPLSSDRSYSVDIGAGDVVLDFSGMNEDAKNFYAEIMLRHLWSELSSGRHGRDTLVCIDEAHRLLNQFERYESVYARMAREMTAFGMLWASSQNFTDMREDVRNQFATQFCFNTSNPEDLRALALIDKKLAWSASSMPLHFFTDARYEWVHYVVPEFVLYYEPADRQLEPARARPEAAGRGTGQAARIDYKAEIMQELRRRGGAYVTRLAGVIAAKYGIGRDLAKLHARKALFELVNCGDVARMRVTAMGRSYVLYYLPSAGESGLHKYMQRFVVAMLKANGIEPAAVSSVGEAVADVSTERFDVEIETGLKASTADLRARIGRSGRLTVIVVPNGDIAERYLRLGLRNTEVATMAGFEELLKRRLLNA